MIFIQEFPRSGAATDLTRININAYQIKQQNLNPRDPNYIQKSGLISSWSFIGFSDIQEGISHNWESYGSILGRVTEKIATAKSDFKQVNTAITGVVGGSEGANKGLQKALNNTNTESAKYKVDTPLVYTGSQRRQISFTFTLQQWQNLKTDVLDPIHEFRKLSCAGIEGKSVDVIDFPAVFSINTIPVGFVHIQDAACTDVQITWNSPHSAGIPKRAELTVTFTDLRPLYKSSWGDAAGGLITTDTE